MQSFLSVILRRLKVAIIDFDLTHCMQVLLISALKAIIVSGT